MERCWHHCLVLHFDLWARVHHDEATQQGHEDRKLNVPREMVKQSDGGISCVEYFNFIDLDWKIRFFENRNSFTTLMTSKMDVRTPPLVRKSVYCWW